MVPKYMKEDSKKELSMAWVSLQKVVLAVWLIGANLKMVKLLEMVCYIALMMIRIFEKGANLRTVGLFQDT